MINDVPTSSRYAAVSIEKDGYFSLTKTLVVSPENDNVVRAQLIRKQLSGSVDACKGGEVSLTTGAKIKLPAGAVIDPATNAPYTGKVNVYMAWMDPSDVRILYQMPGDLRGTTTSGAERMIITYGMINVDLETEGKKKLQLDPSKPAELNYPVPAILISGAPATSPMWHFDEATGRWKEEGVAKLVGSNYVTSVKHFSCWNVDVVYDQPLIKYCVYVIDENKKPYLNSHILIRRANDKWGAHGYTNADGYVCGQIPMNTPLKLEILGEVTCEQAFLSSPIGPYKNDVLIDTVVVRRNPEKMVTITGTAVDCNDNPITSGYVQGSIRSLGFVGKITNGKFEFTITRCPADLDFTIFGVDTKTNNMSAEKSYKIKGLNEDVGKLVLCADPSQTIKNAMIAHYPFDGDIKDYSGNALDGKLGAGTLDPASDRRGVAGKAYLFDPNDKIEVPNSATKNPYPMSISFWMNIDASSPGPTHNILKKYETASWNGFYFQVNNYTASLGWSFMPAYMNELRNNVSGEYSRPFYKAPFQTGQWVHVVFVVDDAGGKIYTNNNFYGSLPWETGPGKACTTNALWIIGGINNEGLKGRLDEMRIYNRALLEIEIKYLFEN
jgi:hypothetical protein